MLLEIILDYNWQDIIFYVICVIGVILALAAIPQDIWHFVVPFIIAGLVLIGVVTYFIWYLTSYKAGWYDLSYWSVFGIGIGVSVLYFIVASIIVNISEKKDVAKRAENTGKTKKL